MALRIHLVSVINECPLCVNAMRPIHVRVFFMWKETARKINATTHAQRIQNDMETELDIPKSIIYPDNHWQRIQLNSRRHSALLKFIKRAHS